MIAVGILSRNQILCLFRLLNFFRHFSLFHLFRLSFGTLLFGCCFLFCRFPFLRCEPAFITLCHSIHIEAFEKPDQRLIVRIEGALFRRNRKRHIGADRRELLGKHRKILSFLYLAPGRPLELFRVFQHGLDIAVLTKQFQSGLFADAGNAGDIVGVVPHQTLEVNDLGRRDAHLLFEFLFVHDLDFTDSLLHQDHRSRIIDQLKQIVVGGENAGGIVLCLTAHRSDEIIRFDILHLHPGNVIAVKIIPGQLKLRHEIIGCGFSAAFVVFVEIMAERMLAGVKGNENTVGIYDVDRLLKHIGKSENGIGRNALLCAHAHAVGSCVIRPEQHRVAVCDQQFFHGCPPSRKGPGNTGLQCLTLGSNGSAVGTGSSSFFSSMMTISSSAGSSGAGLLSSTMVSRTLRFSYMMDR